MDIFSYRGIHAQELNKQIEMDTSASLKMTNRFYGLMLLQVYIIKQLFLVLFGIRAS